MVTKEIRNDVSYAGKHDILNSHERIEDQVCTKSCPCNALRPLSASEINMMRARLEGDAVSFSDAEVTTYYETYYGLLRVHAVNQ